MFQWLLNRLRKSPNPLFIQKGESLLQIDGRVYKLPEGIENFKKLKHDKRLTERVIQLAKENGVNFESLEYGANCLECQYNGIFIEACQKKKTAVGNSRDYCIYPGRKNISLVCLFLNEKRKIEFMAVEQICAVDDAFYMAMVEQGYLDKYLLEGIEPKNFPSIREFEPESELEKQACREYKLMS